MRLLEALAGAAVPVWLIVSGHGFRLLQAECGIGDIDALKVATGGDWRSVQTFPDDDRGALLPSGVYFYRVHAGAEAITKKMVIAR